MSNNVNVKALDDGYGDIKMYGKNQPELIPSFITSFKPKPEESFGSNNSAQYIAVEYQGSKFVVGDYAAKLDPNIQWVGGENKHSDTRFPVLLSTSLALMSSSQQEVIDCLMMNLPINYDTPQRQELLRKLAIGTHQLKISTDGVNFHDKIITVEDIIVKKQPFGSLCDLILDDEGNIVDETLAQGVVVNVDIGSRTLNILTVDGLQEQPNPLSLQTNDGVFTAYQYIGDWLAREWNMMIPEGKLPQIVQSRQLRGQDLTPLIHLAYENLANNILNILDRTLINYKALVDAIVFTGGGAEILEGYLQRASELGSTRFLNRFSNVRGLRKYGIRRARGGRESKKVPASRTKHIPGNQTRSSKHDGGISIKVGNQGVR
jgi:plasmid segregation protein ParM